MGIYISSYEAITPVNSLEKQIAGTPNIHQSGYYECISPDFRQYIEPKLSRRMSKVVKMGIACAKKCIEQAGIEQAESILVGTGLGCIKDTAKFLDQIVSNDEQMVTPTAFIQSTHNTVSGQIALMLQCKNHNLTFSQKNISFETALLETMMNFETGLFNQALLLGIDEITTESFELLQRTGCLKSQNNPKGYIAGEGAVAFSVTAAQMPNSVCHVENLVLGRKNDTFESLLQKTGVQIADVDYILSDSDDISNEVAQIPNCNYKALVGEYDTASAFAVWLGALLLSNPETSQQVNAPEKPECILVYNNYKDGNKSLIALSKC